MKSFFKSPDKKKKYILICGDIFVLCLGLLAGFFINFFMKSGGVSTFMEALPDLTLLPIILALVNISLLFLSVASLLSTIYAVTAYVVGAFDIDIVFNKKQNVINIALSVALSMLINFVVINVIFDQFFDKYIWLFFVLFTFFGVVIWRKIFYNNFIISDPYDILIIDPDKLAKKASLLLTNSKHNIFRIAEITEEEFFAKYLFIDNKDGWRKYNLIVFPFLTNLSNDHMISLVKTKFWGISTCSSLTFYIHSTGSIPVFDIGPNKLIDLSVTLALSNPLQRRIKRVMDILFSLCGFVISFPVMLIVAGLIKATCSGPVLFIQERVGLHEKPFKLYKFRTMTVNAEKDTGPVWAQKDDPRVTPIGSFLRKSRLDELPQLYNVFKGEMSFIGPRPFRRFFTDKLSRDFPFYFLRFYIKPGLTGWAQVSAEYDNSIDGHLKKLEYELFYMQEYTLFLDAVIILKTIKTVVWAKGH